MIADKDIAYFQAQGAQATAEEISGQAQAWLEIPQLLQRDQAALPALAAALNNPQATVVFSGAGTSAYVGDIVAPLIAPLAAAHCQAIASTDFVAQPADRLPRHAEGIFFAFARSGNSPESVDSIEKLAIVAPKMQPYAVTCNAQGQLALDERTYSLLMPPQTHDASFVMTSSFSTMTLYTAALCRQALGLATADFSTLAEASQQINRQFYHSATADTLLQAQRLIFLGSSALYGAARECALKILEMTAGAIPTMAETSLGFRHGPKSLINAQTAVMVLPSNHAYTQQFDADIIRELANDGSAAAIVVPASAEFFARFEDIAAHPSVIALPYAAAGDSFSDDYLAVLAVQYAQLLGLRAAIERRISPDNPNPSGQVNRVVKGVRLYPYSTS